MLHKLMKGNVKMSSFTICKSVITTRKTIKMPYLQMHHLLYDIVFVKVAIIEAFFSHFEVAHHATMAHHGRRVALHLCVLSRYGIVERHVWCVSVSTGWNGAFGHFIPGHFSNLFKLAKDSR